MRMKPKVIKVPCGGWVAEGEAGWHVAGCEYCEAIEDLKKEKVNRVVIAIFVVFFFGLFGWLGYSLFSDPWW